MVSKSSEISYCEVCLSKHLKSVLNLGMHPLCDDLIPINSDLKCDEFPIEILYCTECRTAHQRFQVEKETLFPNSYHYRSGNTADVLKGMALFVDTCEERLLGLKNKKVLDVGCNDGSLLSIFQKRGAISFGVEPTNAFLDAKKAGHVVVNDYLTEEMAHKFVKEHGVMDVITFTNVFAHIEDLQGVLRSLNILRHSDTVVMIENHYLGAILERKQFDTFYHEHPRTYSYGSFVKIAESLGMEIDSVDFPARYGGNISVFLTPTTKLGNATNSRPKISDIEKVFYPETFEKLARDIELWRLNKKKEIEIAVSQYGPLIAKAFPGRAAIPVRMLGLDHSLVKGAYEKPESQKVGHWVPGTRIPIVSDEHIMEDLPRGAPILNFAWHIDDEIKSYMKEKGFTGPYINII